MSAKFRTAEQSCASVVAFCRVDQAKTKLSGGNWSQNVMLIDRALRCRAARKRKRRKKKKNREQKDVEGEKAEGKEDKEGLSSDDDETTQERQQQKEIKLPSFVPKVRKCVKQKQTNANKKRAHTHTHTHARTGQ